MADRMEHLLHARNWTRCLTSFISGKRSMWRWKYSLYFTGEETEAQRHLNKFPKITLLISSRGRILSARKRKAASDAGSSTNEQAGLNSPQFYPDVLHPV